MNDLYELYESLSRRYNIGDKPYSSILDLAIILHWQVIREPELRCFKLVPNQAMASLFGREYEYTSIQISQANYVCLNDLCKAYSTNSETYSRRAVCLMSIRFLQWYLGNKSIHDSIFYGNLENERKRYLHTLNSRFDSWVDGLFPNKELFVEETDEDE